MKQRTLALFSSVAMAAALTACSDSPAADMPTPPADTTVPLSAQASTATWTGYAAALPDSDRSEPLDVNASTPPVSDTEEPRPI